MSSWSLPMFEPMSLRSMCGQDRFSSNASAPCVLAAPSPASASARARVSLPEPAMIDATRIRSGIRLLDPRDARHPPVERLVGDQLPVPRRVERRVRAASASRVAARPASTRRNFVFGPAHVDDRVQADRLGDDAAPAGVEGAHDVAVGLGRRRRRQQERVLEPQAGEGRRRAGRAHSLRSEQIGEQAELCRHVASVTSIRLRR